MSASPWTASRHPHRVVLPVVGLEAALPCFDAPAGVRRRLAIALVADTLGAASRARLPLEVLVATPDPEVRTMAAELGVRALPGCEGDTAEAITRSAKLAADREGLNGAIAVLASTLPCLLPSELDAALMSRTDRRVEYPDLGGRVATLRADTNGWPAVDPPHFHEPIERVLRRLKNRQFLPGLACHVSTIDSLRIAMYIGVGPATEAALEDIALPHHRTGGGALLGAFEDVC